MKLNSLYTILIGAGLTACSSFLPKTWSSETTVVAKETPATESIERQIQPYRDSLSSEMNAVIGFSSENLVKGRPCSDLNNWAADALLKDQAEIATIRQPNMALLNVGGLRSSINKGSITTGDIFSFMPFDNEVVWVKMPISALGEMEMYLKKSGGEPISNAQMKSGKLSLNNPKENVDYFWILTSDYLANGGDNMSFFAKKIEVIATNKLLRNCFIDQVKKEGTLVIDKKCRIHVEE